MSDNVIRPDWLNNGRASIEPLSGTDAGGQQTIGGGDGGPHDPGMEPRVAALEAGLARIEAKLETLSTKADLVKVDDRIRKIEADGLPGIAKEIAELKGRVSQLPTTMQVFTYMGGLIGLTVVIGGVVIAVAHMVGH